jgi:hypothetical protein
MTLFCLNPYAETMGDFRRTIPNLAAIREHRGIPLDQIVRSTKISPYYIQAIEQGDLRKLPEGVYARSYIRQYARAIDFNEHDLLDAFGLSADKEPPPAEQPPPAPPGCRLRVTACLAHAWQLARGRRVNAS